MQILKLLLLVASVVASASTIKAQTISPQEKQQIHEWKQSNPEVKIYSTKEYNELSALDKTELNANPFALIYAGNTLRIQDIDTYTQNFDPIKEDIFLVKDWVALNKDVMIMPISKYTSLNIQDKQTVDLIDEKIIYSGTRLTMTDIHLYETK
ncbi:MAG: hypothetical protein GY810_19580 [Aureispira sp.]|nr:hypothetical protein [Aureispira sp.]